MSMATGIQHDLYLHTPSVEGIRYRPRTQATRVTLDLILTIVAKILGDVPQEVVHDAADVTLEYLKDEDLKDFDKKKEIDDLLGASLSPKEFDKLVDLGKKITDYPAWDEDGEMHGADDDQETGERQHT